MAESREILIIRLNEARAALHQLLIGKSVVSISRGDSAGNSRSYQYSQADISQLRAYILELESLLGLGNGRRRPAGVRI
ncbi:head-tail joining protein [Salmonella enterica subsp. enterica serovar Namur str. 05-2929]|uniref:gpW family head-tail joining protein n=1 Tax=Salmonella enterica TaxID=28901 RepID=UPI00043381CC|nr:gpW family head-tail joining protein [Salmonella enterica]EAB8047240.1 hypothetical protein [Salmonella enterica subsp. enterica serovar Tees]EBH8772619.1 hypothetical protein [Salmonella enterica subsp. enterica serovar Lagos]EBR8060637.1 hypothetical protein [Salmonella enterica subsp. enterica serovar Soerenga]EBU8551982.1 hypothetical protein [Salmonella enterica subsp. enterica serovar Telelkebir]EBX5572421.1 hypothetical protein [Salmonella enterica subsp. enterica serovar Kuessel]EB